MITDKKGEMNMKLDFFKKETYIPLNKNVINEIERELNIKIPLDIKNFLLYYNGCKTEKSIIKSFENYNFIFIDDIKRVLERIQIWKSDGYTMTTENQKILPFSRIGNTDDLCFIFDKENNYKIGYYNLYELELNEINNKFNGLHYIADNLEDFFNLLEYPEDYTEPYLKIHDKFEIESEIYRMKKIKNDFFNDIKIGLIVYGEPYIFLKENNEFICYKQIKIGEYIKTNKTFEDFDEYTYYQKILKIKDKI